MTCVVLDDYQGVAATCADWGPLDGRVRTVFLHEHHDDEDALVAALAEADVVVTVRERVGFGASVLDRLPRLSLLVASGMRNSVIDHAAAARNGVVVCGTSSSPTPPVELTWALVLGLTKGLVTEHANLRSGGPWQSTVGADLHGAVLGVLGLGKVGSAVARVGAAFGMQVLAWSQNLTQETADDAGVRRAGSLSQLLTESDVVTVHLQLSDRTRGLLGDAELRQLKPSAYLVNTSRAAIVSTPALLDALHADRLAGAGLDVFEREPLPLDDPLRHAPRLLTTPHLGYVTRGNLERYYRESVEDITAFLDGAPIRLLAPAPSRT